MDTASAATVDEIAPTIFRISTWIPGTTEQGFPFNQFLLTGEEPVSVSLQHATAFSQVSAAISRVIPLQQLRWICFAHVEADEHGAVNMLLAAAPNAEVIHGPLACMLSLNDIGDRAPIVASEDHPHDIGGHRLRFIATPHVPHNWESGLWFARDHLDAAGRRPAHPHRTMPGIDRLRLRCNDMRSRIAVSCHRTDRQSGAHPGTPGAAAADHAGADAWRLLRRRRRAAQLRALSEGYALMAR